MPYFSKVLCNSLRKQVAKNYTSYFDGNIFEKLEKADVSEHLRVLDDFEIDVSVFDSLSQERSAKSDALNTLAIWNAMPNLTAKVAAHEGVWTALAHQYGLEYIRRRHLLKLSPKSSKEGSVHKRFFANGKRKLQEENGIGRLWWPAYMCNRSRKFDLAEAIHIIVGIDTDLRKQFFERPTVMGNVTVMDAVLSTFKEIHEQDERHGVQNLNRDNWRNFMKTVDKIGGRRLLSVAKDESIDKEFKSLFRALVER